MKTTGKEIFLSFSLLVVLFVSSCGSKKQESTTAPTLAEEEIVTTEFLNGKKIYETRCANCHKKDGKGMGALFPPIAASDYLPKNIDKVICSIKYGSNEVLVVNGKSYKMPMPPQADLNEIEISDVMNYILNSWGNKHGPINVEKVQEALSNCQ